MAELRINIDTQAAAASARDLQRILNDIKMAARDLDNLSLGTLGGTISRVADSMRTMQSAVSSTAPTVASIVTAVQGLSQALEGGIRSQQAWVAQWQAFNGTGNYAREQLAALGQALTNLLGISSTFANSLSLNGQQFLAFSTSAKTTQQALEALRGSMPPIVTVAQQTADAFSKAGATLPTFAASARDVNDALTKLRATAASMQQGVVPPFGPSPSASQVSAFSNASFSQGFNPYTQQMLEEQARVAEQDRLAVQNAIRRRTAAAAGPAAQQTFLAPGTMYGQPQMPAGPGFADPTSQGVTGIAISNQRVYQTLATSAQQATQAVTPLGQAMVQTKEKKDVLDKNIERMSSSSGSLWQMSFAFRTLASLLGALSFRALYEEAKSLAETLVDTGMQLERATSLFGLMGNSTMTSAQGIELATKTAQEFGLAVLPAIEGLGRMQASAYGTASAGDAVNTAFKGMMAGLGATAADSRTVTSAMTALADSIGRVEISGRTIRQISRDFPGFRERMAEAFGTQDVEHFMLILDKGQFTVSQYLKAFQQAFSGTVLEMAKQNVNTLSGAVAGFQNALLGLIQTMLEAGFKRDFITGLQDLTAILTSPEFLDGAKQFAQIFGVVVKGALEAVAAILVYVRDHLALVGGVIAGLVSAGGMLTFAATVLTLARAFQILGVSLIGVSGPIGIIAALVGAGAAYWIAHSKATMDAQKATDDLTKSTTGLVTANKDVAASVPTEHMVRYAKDEKLINDEVEKLRLTTLGYRDELDLLESGIQKDSVAFTGLATALKFYNEQVSHGNVAFDQAAIQRLKDYAVAAAAAAAGIAKIAENRNQIRNIREESDITQRLTTMAAGGASEATLGIERQFQEQFRAMRAHFEDLIYNERDTATRNRLVEQFKQQANALREVSVQAQLYSNQLKAIQDQTKGEQDFQMEEDLLRIWTSIDDTQSRYTKEATRETPSTIASYVPPTISPASDTINAFMYQLDRANIGAQRQEIHGPVEINISGNITIANPLGINVPGAQSVNVQGTTVQGAGVPGIGVQGSVAQGGVSSSATALARAGQYSDLIMQASAQTGLPPQVIQAFIAAESAGNPNARSRAGAQGLMQLMPATAAGQGVTDPFDPGQNIAGGSRYLAGLAPRYGGNIAEMAAAYNAGPNAVRPGSGVPNIPETQNFVRTILANIQQLGGLPTSAEAAPRPTPLVEPESLRPLKTYQELGGTLEGPEATTQGMGKLPESVYGPQDIDKLQSMRDTVFSILDKARATFDFIADLGGKTRQNLFPNMPAMTMEGEPGGSFIFKPKEQLFPPTPGIPPIQMPIEEGRKIEAEQERLATMQQYEAIRRRTEQQALEAETQKRQEQQTVAAIVKRREQETLAGLRVEEGGLQPTALGQESFRPGQITTANMPRTRIEAQRDQAARRALQEYNQNVQLSPEDISQNTEAYRRVQQQREQVEFQARRGVDRRVIEDQKNYNIALADQNRDLALAQTFITTDIKYREIDAKAAQEQRKALENSVSPELLARTQALIEEERQLARAQVDMNGPIQQSIDSIGNFKDRSETLFVGALNSMGDALATFASTGKVDMKSFADAFIADLVRMEYQLLIMKPLLMAIQGQGTFGENVLGGLGGTSEGSMYGSEIPGMGAVETASYLEGAGMAGEGALFSAGLKTGGYVTLRGLEHFQGGGLVGGGRDSVPAMLSPGEVILNQAQQRSVAASMQGGGNTYVFSPTVHAQDAESVRKTLPQIQAEFYRATERMARRNNIRGNV